MPLVVGVPWLVAVSFGCAGCADDSGAGGTAVVRDSAGVEIVENHAPAWTKERAWTVVPRPSFDVGGDPNDTTQQFSDVTAATRLSDGRIVVADAEVNALRIFGADGRFIAQAGRHGGGPGEFNNIGTLVRRPGDTLLVWDRSSRRLSRFDPSGRFVSAVTASAQIGSFPTLFGVFGDGSLAVLANGPFSFDNTGLVRARATVIRLHPDGSLADTLAGILADELVVNATRNGNNVSMTMFMPTLFHKTFGRVAGGSLFVGDNARYEIARYDTAGAVTRLIRRDEQAVPFTDDIMVALGNASANADADVRRQVEERMRNTPHPDSVGYFLNLLAVDDGALWVREMPLPGDTIPVWSVFDTAGRYQGTITMPPRFDLLEIGSDYVLGTWKDDLDVEHVRMYPLRKP
ncbi:MAG TPA: 6-bladed beta-propeller [Gemmatimonadaceae bacterium]|nr:6-bladed beta-propeller [Gemmatimonadaceae bacterium]